LLNFQKLMLKNKKITIKINYNYSLIKSNIYRILIKIPKINTAFYDLENINLTKLKS